MQKTQFLEETGFFCTSAGNGIEIVITSLLAVVAPQNWWSAMPQGSLLVRVCDEGSFWFKLDKSRNNTGDCSGT
jgi:hypothetical protein